MPVFTYLLRAGNSTERRSKKDAIHLKAFASVPAHPIQMTLLWIERRTDDIIIHNKQSGGEMAKSIGNSTGTHLASLLGRLPRPPILTFFFFFLINHLCAASSVITYCRRGDVLLLLLLLVDGVLCVGVAAPARSFVFDLGEAIFS